MAENMLELIQVLPEPTKLWAEAVKLSKEDEDYHTLSENIAQTGTHSFSRLLIEDGAGTEGNFIVRVNADNKIDAALLYTYDHESSLTANIGDSEGAQKQPALSGIPSEFDPVTSDANSPLFWKYEDFPATFTTIFATAAVWFVDGEWGYADGLEEAEDSAGELIEESQMVSQFRSVFEEFRFANKL